MMPAQTPPSLLLERKNSAFSPRPNFRQFQPLPSPIGPPLRCPRGFEELGYNKMPSEVTPFAYCYNEMATINSDYSRQVATYKAQVAEMEPFLRHASPATLQDCKEDAEFFAEGIRNLQLLFLNDRMRELEKSESARNCAWALKPTPIKLNKWNVKAGGDGKMEVLQDNGPFSPEDREVQLLLKRVGPYTGYTLTPVEVKELYTERLEKCISSGGEVWAPIRGIN